MIIVDPDPTEFQIPSFSSTKMPGGRAHCLSCQSQELRCDAAQLPATRYTTVLVGILDKSGSMAVNDYPPSRIEAGKESILGFAELRRRICPSDYFGLVAFDHTATVVFRPRQLGDTDCLTRLQDKLRLIRPSGGTDMQEGLKKAKRLLFKKKRHNEYPLQVPAGYRFRVIGLTDGHSEGDPVQIAAELQAAGVVIEVIGIGGSPSDVNEQMLKQCASYEDGQLLYRFIGDGDSEALADHFCGIALR